jgi:hypothetical protein
MTLNVARYARALTILIARIRQIDLRKHLPRKDGSATLSEEE